MNATRKRLALLVVLATPACGKQLVQFGEPDLSMGVDSATKPASADLSVTPDASEQPDIEVLADSAMSDLLESDLSMPDLAIPDLMMTDHMTPDLRVSDLTMSDRTMPDLFMPDLLPDLLMTDLPALDLGPMNPGPLRSLENYAIVASSTITNTGASTIIGSIALSPGPMITGIPMGMPINGSIHVADGPAAQAQMDLTFAYNLMVAKPCGTNLTGMDLGGKTLAPGVYCFNSSAAMAIGSTLILDAKADPNASWTFQIASTLILGNFAKIQVINGGRDCSVYWQVGSSATVGTGARVAGSILANASITLTKGASAGRALARSGGVTMDTNDIAVGPCH